jgi:hypothetical protein
MTALHKYALQVARLCNQEYSWFYTPVSVHKILTDESEIILAAIQPTGQLSKEAQESRNKDVVHFRRCHRRETSGENVTSLLRLVTFTSDFIKSTNNESTVPIKKSAHFLQKSFN